MIKACRGWIAGAGLDVMERDVGHNNSDARHGEVILTANRGLASSRLPRAQAAVWAEMELAVGKWPAACVNPAVLESRRRDAWQPVSMERGPGITSQ